MNTSVLPNTLIFSGVLDELVALGDLHASLAKLQQAGIKPPVTLDFSKVSYANSAGVVTWLKFLNEAKIPFNYVNAPIWQVNQFNSVKGYFQPGTYVESVQAPYFSPRTQDSCTFTLVIGKDVPILEDYSSITVPNRRSDGNEFEIDFMPQSYFSFISENYPLFKEKLK